MASYALSIKPYAIPSASKAASTPWLVLIARTSVKAGKQLQRLGHRISTAAPWYDESEHGNRLVMLS